MLLRVFAILFVLVLVTLNVVLRVVSMSRSGVDPGSPYALGYMTGGVLVLPLIAAGIAAIWRANRTATRLLMAANIGLVVALLGAAGGLAKGRGPTVHKAAAARADDYAAKFRSGVMEACLEKCARNGAGLGVAPDRCQAFCTCAAVRLLALDKTGGSKDDMEQVMRQCVTETGR
jgi:hypothetical protein